MRNRNLKGAIAFLREAWNHNDGAEGDSVRLVCSALEKAGVVEPPEYSTDACEQAYLEGRRRTLINLASHFAGELGRAAGCEVQSRLQAYAERQETVSALRKVCAEYGDNDWPDELWLPDVIEKHLHRNLNDSKEE